MLDGMGGMTASVAAGIGSGTQFRHSVKVRLPPMEGQREAADLENLPSRLSAPGYRVPRPSPAVTKHLVRQFAKTNPGPVFA